MVPAPTLFQAFLHYNYKYDWLRPTLEEIVDTYTKLYGKESLSRTLSRTGLLQRGRRMERRIKREDTRRTITVLCVTLNKKTHTVSALELHCALSTEHSECTQHSVHNQS